jgi:predicted RNase H-like nuclease (RuvC/YqgF family)
MKQIISTTLLLLAFLSTTLNAQQISSEAYNKDVIHEDFNTEGEYFKIVTTTDNYFILDKGDYLLSRNNKDSEYAIIANNSSVTDFVIKTAVRIGPSDNKKASVGIILKAQQDGKGAIIFEINKKKEYRIKQLIGSNYQTLSGNAKQEGWVKNKLVNGVDEHNFIEIRSEKNIYDIYINSEYLTTFFIPDFTSGSCGLIISPATKARISYYYINTKGESTAVANYTNENTASVNETIEQLNKRIVILEENNAKLNELNSDSKALQSDEIKALIAKNTSLANITIEQEKEIIELNSDSKALQSDEIKALTTKNTSLANITIEQEKEIIELNSLITSLKEKSKKTEELETSNISLQTTVSSLTSENNSLSSEVKTLTTRNSDLASITTNQYIEIKNNSSLEASFNNTIKELESSKAQLLNEVNTLKVKNTELASISSTQEKEITALTTAIENFKNTSNQSSATNKQLNKKISGLKQQISLEQATNTDLTNQINKINKSTNTQITQLTNQVKVNLSQVKTLKNKVTQLQTSNLTLSADLSTEKSAHKNTKSGISKSVRNKTTEINTLTTDLNNAKEQLKTAKKTAKSLKECATNVSTLSGDLWSANTELSTLKTTQTKHDKVTADLNSKITVLSNQISTLELQLQTTKSEISVLEITNTELKALFIQKDFELNGVKASDMVKETTVYIPTPKNLKSNKVVYAVQLGMFMQTQSASVYKNLDAVWYQSNENGTYQYLSGEFSSPKEATDHQKAINAKGYSSAFVVTITK